MDATRTPLARSSSRSIREGPEGELRGAVQAHGGGGIEPGPGVEHHDEAVGIRSAGRSARVIPATATRFTRIESSQSDIGRWATLPAKDAGGVHEDIDPRKPRHEVGERPLHDPPGSQSAS